MISDTHAPLRLSGAAASKETVLIRRQGSTPSVHTQGPTYTLFLYRVIQVICMITNRIISGSRAARG